jgi:hypothetical protein
VLRIVVAAPGLDFSTVNARGETALHLAVTWPLAYPDVLTMFDQLVASATAAGLDINQRISSGVTALHLAVCDNVPVAKRLIAREQTSSECTTPSRVAPCQG